MILLDAGERVVAAFSEKLSRKVAKELAELGVTVREGARATAIDSRGVTSRSAGRASGSTARTVIWAAGVHAVPLTERSPGPPGRAPTAAGRIEVNPT